MRLNLKPILVSSLFVLPAVLGLNSFAQISEVTRLAGSEWGPENGFDQFVQFKAQGELFGFAGCNSFIGNYTYKAGEISIEELIITKEKCPGLDGVEAAFLDGLKHAHKVKLDGLMLKIYDENDIWILGLTRRDFD